MGVLGKIKTGAGLACDNPALVSWYVRNKLRVATVGFERNHLKGASRFCPWNHVQAD